MRKIRYKIMTDLSPKDGRKLLDDNECPSCGEEIIQEMSGPLTDFLLCDNCDEAFDPEEAELCQ